MLAWCLDSLHLLAPCMARQATHRNDTMRLKVELLSNSFPEKKRKNAYHSPPPTPSKTSSLQNTAT